MRYFLHLAYKGTAYHGWQSQKEVLGIQDVVENRLSSLCKTTIKVHPCGRTDAGVHASQFFIHFDCEKLLDDNHIYPLNKILPKDIVAYDFIPVAPKANVQLDATARTYRYYFHLEDHPFLADLSTHFNIESLDKSLFHPIIELILQQKNFRSMCLQPDKHNHTFCTIESAGIIEYAPRRFYFEITANRFLRGMIRLLIQRIIDIVSHKMDIEIFKAALQTGERVPFHTAAPPQGLYLTSVEYDYIKVNTRNPFLY